MMRGRTQIEAGKFDIMHTFESAQPLTFFGDYDYSRKEIKYPLMGRQVRVDRLGRIVEGKGATVKADVARRFRINEDIREIYSRISTDDFIRSSIKEYAGMRLTHNLPWETTLVFILSQFNNVKRIRMTTKKLMERYGDPVLDSEGDVVGSGVPGPEELSSAKVEDLMSCGTGFRAKYLISAAKYCSSSLDLDRISAKDYSAIKDELMEIDGVGDKVADCIALMGYGKLEAFPIDTWIKRLVEAVYFGGKKRSPKQIHEFASERWGALAGYAQQYIFWYGRSRWKTWISKNR